LRQLVRLNSGGGWLGMARVPALTMSTMLWGIRWRVWKIEYIYFFLSFPIKTQLKCVFEI
jgi:hypothetical protein